MDTARKLCFILSISSLGRAVFQLRPADGKLSAWFAKSKAGASQFLVSPYSAALSLEA
jgi:hypothetical protein